MNENIKKLLEKVEKDKELQAKFEKVKELDEAYKLAASVQGGFTKEEFVEWAREVSKASVQDMSDKDIEKIAGGLPNNILATKSIIAPPVLPVLSKVPPIWLNS